VKTMDFPFTASAAVLAEPAVGVRFQTVSGCPLFRSHPEMGIPIFPNPSNAICMLISFYQERRYK
jgi:hypothetical protein